MNHWLELIASICSSENYTFWIIGFVLVVQRILPMCRTEQLCKIFISDFWVITQKAPSTKHNKNRKTCCIIIFSNLQKAEEVWWFSLCAVQELRYAEFAEELQRNLTFLHKRSIELAEDLKKHHRMIWDQINEIRRTEVGIYQSLLF